jgi:hypothetical protein
MIAWNHCARVDRRPPVEVCEVRLPAERARALHDAFQRFDGWDLPDQSQGEYRRFVFDGSGFFVEVLRNGGYRNYGFDNAELVGYGLYARAAKLEAAWWCAAGTRTKDCPPLRNR